MSKVVKIFTSQKKPIGQAADKVSKVIHTYTTNEQLQVADKMITAFIKIYSLHIHATYWMKNLCAELQLKRIVINHLQTETA